MPFIRDREYSPRKPDPFWRASRIAARLLLKPAWSLRDRRIAAVLLADPGVEDRLIDQALAGIQAKEAARK